MTLARWLLVGHLAALAFGLAGILVALPNPQLWADDPNAARVFAFGMTYGGATHIVFGAAAMFAFGRAVLGFGRTLVFFVASTALSLGSELIGTGTGWPFGNYEYTSFLGYKVLDRVPFTIPLSWFYVGLACYLLGDLIAARAGGRRALWAPALGVWLLTAWDLVLDPAMADPGLRIRFWTWHETGPYFGMPVQNFVGWSLTGLVYMGLSRLLWRGDPDLSRSAPVAWFPLVVYAANVVFAMALSLSAGLWIPAVLAVVAGIVPASLALGAGRPRPAAEPGERTWRTAPTR